MLQLFSHGGYEKPLNFKVLQMSMIFENVQVSTNTNVTASQSTCDKMDVRPEVDNSVAE